MNWLRWNAKHEFTSFLRTGAWMIYHIVITKLDNTGNIGRHVNSFNTQLLHAQSFLFILYSGPMFITTYYLYCQGEGRRVSLYPPPPSNQWSFIEDSEIVRINRVKTPIFTKYRFVCVRIYCYTLLRKHLCSILCQFLCLTMSKLS